MNHKGISLSIFLLSLSLYYAAFAYAENIDPNNDGSQYAYGENTGWINFEPNVPEPNVGAMVSDDKLTGFIWAENIGWINLAPKFGGVTNDGTGLISGFAWGENVGWINFDPNVPDDTNHYGVTIDSKGNFGGWAWGENIGWIHLQSTFIVDWDDLKNFADQWLQTASELEADLYKDGNVDLVDYSILANYWLDYCPHGWRLGPASYKVKTLWITTCIVDLDDLVMFCDLWLQAGSEVKADFDDSNDVDFMDYCTLADRWLRLCPVGWPLRE